jgi:GTPase SAR1 family protein
MNESWLGLSSLKNLVAGTYFDF